MSGWFPPWRRNTQKKIRYLKNISSSCDWKDLRIASLEGLLEDKKRESITYKSKILRSLIKSLYRKLEVIEKEEAKQIGERNGI